MAVETAVLMEPQVADRRLFTDNKANAKELDTCESKAPKNYNALECRITVLATRADQKATA